MPDIELRGNQMDGDWILAIMNFPVDQLMRESFYAIQCVTAELEDSKTKGYVELEVDFVNALLDAPSHAELRDRLLVATKRGLVAGDFLNHIFAMDCFPLEFKEPSVGKAIALSQAFARKSRYGDGSKIPASETAIRAYIAEFRSVAHLWAALRLHQTFPTQEHREILASPGGVKTFLGIAATLQDFGCGFIPKRAKPRTPLLDSSSIWRVSDSIPRLRPPWKSAPTWLLNTIKGYKPRTRS